jgi:hypothetical protein
MRVTDEIHKPERDDRLYRRVTFPNGLEALLISDPSLVRSRAAAAVARDAPKRTNPSLVSLVHNTHHPNPLLSNEYTSPHPFRRLACRPPTKIPKMAVMMMMMTRKTKRLRTAPPTTALLARV